MNARNASCTALLLLCAAACLASTFATRAGGQEIQWGDLSGNKTAPAQRVSVDAEAISVTANRPDWVELRFHVAPGFHINSHTPHDETLIPTALKLSPSPNYRVVSDRYPEGTPLRLTTGAGETLSTYEGEFRVRVQIVATKGDAMLTGSLHYQACNAASCFPPRDLPVSVALSGR